MDILKAAQRGKTFCTRAGKRAEFLLHLPRNTENAQLMFHIPSLGHPIMVSRKGEFMPGDQSALDVFINNEDDHGD